MNQGKKIVYSTMATLYNSKQGGVRIHATMVVDGEDREMRTGITYSEKFTSSMIVHIDKIKATLKSSNKP